MSVPAITETGKTPSSWKSASAAERAKRRYPILFEGRQLSLLRKGKGKDAVFLHGYLSSKECFSLQINCLSRSCRVTAFDFPGMGKSAPLSEAWGVEEYAAHTARLLDSLGVRGARLVAHSFGGRVALKLLASRPDLFSRALLVGCAGIPPKRGIRYRAKVAAYRAVRRAAPRFAERHFGSAEYRTLSPLMRESYKKIVNEDLTPCLSRIRVPVLYVFGEKDTATPPYMARALARGTEGSGLVFLENCSHFCFVEQPEKFNAVMLEFFR